MTVNERIQAPEGVKKLMEELWLKHQLGEKSSKAQVYMVDLPEPTEEEKRIMVAKTGTITLKFCPDRCKFEDSESLKKTHNPT